MTHYGRHALGRPNGKENRCQGCGVRMTIGDPRPTNVWPERLILDDFTVNVLLTAAADYQGLCREVDEPQSAVEFVDWVAGVVRQSGRKVDYDHDGAPARNESGTESDSKQMRHRHPDPIPFAPLPRTWQR